MKKSIILIVIALNAITAFAGTKIVYGSLDSLLGEKNIPVSVNWKEAVYANYGNIDDFLAKAIRDEKWESLSMNYFYQQVNERAGEYGVRLVSPEKGDNTKFRIEVVPHSISKGGDIKGEILIYNTDNESPIAQIAFSSDESDDNDKIAFRDQFESIGESFGKLLKKQLKEAFKNK